MKNQSEPYRLDASVEFDSQKDAERFEKIMLPEVGDFQGKRARVGLERSGKELRFSVEAKDINALRAIINSLFRLLSVAESVK